MTTKPEQDEESIWLPVAEAAAQLGVKLRNLQRKAAAGEVPSRKEGRRTFVLVQMADIARNDAKPVQGVPDAHLHESDASLREHLATVQGEVQFLRAQLDAANVEKSELRRLMLMDKSELQELRQKIAAPETTEKAEGSPVRHWWEVWRRG